MSKYKKSINIILIIAITTASFIAGAYLVSTQKIILPFLNPNPKPIVCTQEAKQCPNGSYVSRTGPNCEFAKCPEINPVPTPIANPTPTPNPNEKQVSLKEGQREGSLLVQKIYSNYITGLNFPEYPLVTGQGYPITLYIGETASNGCTITLTLMSIEGNTAKFIEKTDFNKSCPICLAENTLIDTPGGQIPVQELQKGMAVWTINKFGKKVSAIIIKTSKTPVPQTHRMVHVILDDKREIFASPGHPVGDGKTFNDISVGDILDNSRIITAKKVQYNKDYTYDILPSGDTGLYFANEILIDNTLH